MKISNVITCFLCCILISGTGLFLFSQEQETVREEVSVVNIEVPVRVYLKGKPVKHLSREDFEIFEGRERREINGFFIKKKRIKIRDNGQTPVEKSTDSRYFVLVFHIREFNKHLENGLKYVFENMMHKNDQLMVMAIGKTLFFNNLIEKERAHAQVSELLKTQAQQARNRMLLLRSKVRNNPMFNVPGNSILKNSLDSLFEMVYDYLKRYERILLDYKKKHLMPEMTSFYNFATHLDTINKEKWVISFYQEESYPHLGPDQKRWLDDIINQLMVQYEHKATYSKMLQNLLLRVERELNAAVSFPAADVQKFFTRTGVTFHSILIPMVNPQSFQFSSGFEQLGFEYKKISTNFENSLRELTKKTGGTLVYSGNLVDSLQTIEEKEDICYWLTFSPKNPEKSAKVRVKVRGSGYKVVYDNNMQPDYFRAFLEKRDVRLNNISFYKGMLRLQISGFQFREKGKEKVGRVSLRVRVKDSQNKDVFDQEKMLQPVKKNINISIPFSWLPKGKYHVIVDAKDLFTGKTMSKFLDPVIRDNTVDFSTKIPTAVE